MPRARIRELAFVAAGFTVLALVTTWPLGANPGRVLPSDLNDTLLNTWILAWDADRLGHALRGVWDPPIFFPYRNTLAFSENLFGLAVFVAPVYWMTGNAILTYNVAFVLSFALAGFGMYLLALSLTSNRAAALVGAVFYAFCPFRFAQMAHIQMVATGWMPVALYALHRYFSTDRRRWLMLFAAAYWLQATTNSYVAYFLAVPAAVVAIDGLARDPVNRRRRLRNLSIAALVIAATLAPVAYRYYRVRVDYGQVRQAAEIESLSADLRSYVVGKSSIGIWRWLPTAVSTDPEKELFPGIAAVLLALVAVAAGSRGPGDARRWIAVYGVIAAAGVVLSLGPVVRVWGHGVTNHGPYEWLLLFVPGWSGMRVPARFAIVVMLGLGVLAAFGARVLVERLRFRTRWIAAALCAALIVAESWTAPIDVHAYSPRGRPTDRAVAQWIGASAPGAVLHLPILTNNFQELHYQFATLLHRHPIVNGYSGYETPLQSLWRDPAGPLSDFDRFGAVVRMLRALGVRYVVVNPGDYDTKQRERREPDRTVDGVRASGQVVREQRLLDAVAFELQSAAPPASLPAGSVPLGRGDFAVSVAQAGDRAANLVDGDPDTRWFGDQDGGSWILATLPRALDLAAVELQMAERSRMDYPRELRIESTDDSGLTRTLYEATPYPEFIAGFVRSAAYPRLSIMLPPNSTRQLRILETGLAPRRWWSVHELRLWRR